MTASADETLEPIKRRYTEEEYSSDDEHKTIPELRFFKVTDNYSIDGDRVTYCSDYNNKAAQNLYFGFVQPALFLLIL